SGRFAQALGIENGLDPSRKLLTLAQKRVTNVFLGRGEELPFQAGTFGSAFLIVTLCFVSAPPEVLVETNRVLRKDGEVVLGLVLRDSPWGQYYGTKQGEGHRFYKHATFYSFEEVKAFLREAGFAIEGMLSTLFPKPGEVRCVESPQKGFSNAAGFVIVWARKA
ncbi:MAG: methyltransferase domain-containing protein, partial [Dehalococcoidia bacterium]|nr:methyltransferase domain-containing protein [Dehalococcoidia bacterium]